MPELPEVETIRRDLLGAILYKPITSVSIIKPKLIRGDQEAFSSIITGNQFIDIERRGKLLSFSLIGDWCMLAHLKMTGQFMYQGDNGLLVGGHSTSQNELDLPNPYSYVIFSFSDNTTLYFNCMRQFGYLDLVEQEKKAQTFDTYGIEPLTPAFTFKKFKELTANKGTNIKAFLLNQKYIAGLGNIYVDEACFQAGIRPNRSIHTLTETEKKSLYSAIKKVLTKAVKERGTTFNNYRDANGNKGNFLHHLKVYGRGGKKCLTCKTHTLQKTKVAGRGTVHCPNCQQ